MGGPYVRRSVEGEHEEMMDDVYVPPAPPQHIIYSSNSNNQGKRFVIHKIIIENFKSYYGINVLGPFHKNFTAIVGPNGSGKSNVIDSMLFVFGHRASKLRSKRVSVLIHNSRNHQKIQRCTVSVHFKEIIDTGGGGSSVDVERSEIVISRTACVDNSSYYSLNGQRVQFKEVLNTLRSHGIDLTNNRFLILQGEVEQIATMKPKGSNEHETGMLEYLDSIIGTDRYKEPMEKLNGRIVDVSTQYERQSERLHHMKKELNELKTPRDNALLCQSVINSIVRAKNELYQKQLHDENKKLQQKTEQKTELASEIESLKMKLSELKQERTEKERAVKDRNSKYGSIKRNLDTQQALFDTCTKNDLAVQADIQQTNQRRHKVKDMLKLGRNKLNELKKVPDKNSIEILTCETEIERLSRQRVCMETELTTLLGGLNEQNQELRYRREQLEKQMRSVKEKEDKAQADFASAELKLKLCLRSEQAETSKLEMLQHNLSGTLRLITDKSKLLNGLDDSIVDIETRLEQMNRNLDKVKQEQPEIGMRIRAVNTKLAERQTTMQSSCSRNTVLDFIMERKRKGDLPGVLGRLGDLGAIDRKYDVAITTSVGSLNHIVVENVNTGERCIEMLKRFKKGCGNFLVLDKQQHLWSKIQSPFYSPESVPRLYDLVRVEDDRVLPAMYFAMRDTLVASDLKQAMRISSPPGGRRFRVVTLEGQVLETSGTMSGCGRPMRGGMGQQVTAKTVQQEGTDPTMNIAHLEEQLHGLKSRQAELMNTRQELEDKIPKLNIELRDKQMQHKKYSIELKSHLEDRPRLEAQVALQKKRTSECIAADPATVHRLQETANATKSIYEDSRQASSEVARKVKLVKDEMQGTSGPIKVLQKKLNAANNKIDMLQRESSRLKVEINSSERNCAKCEERIKSMEAEIKDAEKKLLSLKAAYEGNEVTASNIMTVIEQLQTNLSEHETEHRSLKKALNAFVKTEGSLKMSMVELQQRLSVLDQAVAEINAVVNKRRAQLRRLEIVIVDGLNEEAALTQLNSEELDGMHTAKLEFQLRKLERDPHNRPPNLKAIKDYEVSREKTEARAAVVDELRERKKQLLDYQCRLHEERQDEFMKAFSIISCKLKEAYCTITWGGDANLDLLDCRDPYQGGVTFNVRPPHKPWKQVHHLSGGEKTLSSLALVFALHEYRPTPMYVMDEIDAALDLKNVRMVSAYIETHTLNAQFIVISLRDMMFENAHRLVGIGKQDDCTFSIAIDNDTDNEVTDDEVEEALVGEDIMKQLSSTPRRSTGILSTSDSTITYRNSTSSSHSTSSSSTPRHSTGSSSTPSCSNGSLSQTSEQPHRDIDKRKMSPIRRLSEGDTVLQLSGTPCNTFDCLTLSPVQTYISPMRMPSLESMESAENPNDMASCSSFDNCGELDNKRRKCI